MFWEFQRGRGQRGLEFCTYSFSRNGGNLSKENASSQSAQSGFAGKSQHLEEDMDLEEVK